MREGLLYLSLHRLLIQRWGVNQVVHYKELAQALGRHFLVPKPLRYKVLIEMQKKNLIEKKTGRRFIILGKDNLLLENDREVI